MFVPDLKMIPIADVPLGHTFFTTIGKGVVRGIMTNADEFICLTAEDTETKFQTFVRSVSHGYAMLPAVQPRIILSQKDEHLVSNNPPLGSIHVTDQGLFLRGRNGSAARYINMRTGHHAAGMGGNNGFHITKWWMVEGEGAGEKIVAEFTCR